MKRTLIYILALMLLMPVAVAQKVEMLPYGDFNGDGRIDNNDT